MEKIKKGLDVVMGALFIVLMKIGALGVNFHEIGGLILFLLVSLHKVLNYRWIKSVGKRMFTRKVSGKVKFQFILDMVLFCIMLLTVFSGVLISQTVFTGIAAENRTYWSALHNFFAYSSLLLTSVHVGLHWQRILYFLRKLLGFSGDSSFRTGISRLMALTVAVIGFRIIVQSGIKYQFSAPFLKENTVSVEQIEQKKKRKDNDGSYRTLSLVSTTVLEEDSELEDYLSKLFCSGCGKVCPLTSLQCGRGNRYRQQAIEDYNNTSQNESPNEELQEDITDKSTETTESGEGITFYDISGFVGLVVVVTHYGCLYFTGKAY